MVGSEAVGWSMGVDATDNALCVAAAEGGLVFALADRAGLNSCVLFFLDRPGPGVERADAFALRAGLTGDDSRERIGELAVDETRLDCNFFVAGGIEDIDESRMDLGAFTDICSPLLSTCTGSAVSCAPTMGVKILSSMVAPWQWQSQSQSQS